MADRSTSKIIGCGKTVFEDIGIAMSPEDLLKADIAAFISREIQKRKLTQRETAKVLGIDQPKVSKLLRGRLGEFAIERLFGYLMALGHDIEVSVGERRKVRGGLRLVA